MTYKPGFPISPRDALMIVSGEAKMLAYYIDHPPVIQSPDGQLRENINPFEARTRASKLVAILQDVCTFVEAETAKLEAEQAPPPVESHENGAAAVN